MMHDNTSKGGKEKQRLEAENFLQMSQHKIFFCFERKFNKVE